MGKFGSRGGRRGGRFSRGRGSRNFHRSRPVSCFNCGEEGHVSRECKEVAVWTHAVTEDKVGIECFMNTAPGFSGVLKQRFSDFVVEEVHPSGDLVPFSAPYAKPRKKQEDKAVPKEAESVTFGRGVEAILELTRAAAPTAAAATGDASAQPSEATAAAAAAVAGAEGGSVEEGLRAFVAAGLAARAAQKEGAERGELVSYVLPADPDKGRRKQVHSIVRECMRGVVSDTVEGDVIRRIRLRFTDTGPKGGAGRGGGRDGGGGGGKRKRQDFDPRGGRLASWPKDKQHLQFTLVKRNTDTMSAISAIARALHRNPKTFAFAGTKDKRGITVQRVTGLRVRLDELARINWDRGCRGVKVGEPQYVSSALRLGQLKGNRFTIALRDLSQPQSTVDAAVQQWKDSGFINYFGLQRFGTRSIPSHHIGREVLQKRYAQAVDMMLAPEQGGNLITRKALTLYKESGDANAALRKLPTYAAIERSLLSSLRSSSPSHYQALVDLPGATRMLLVHSYQSYLFNKAASLRLSTMDKQKPVAGDLVLLRGGGGDGEAEEEEEEEEDSLLLAAEEGVDTSAMASDADADADADANATTEAAAVAAAATDGPSPAKRSRGSDGDGGGDRDASRRQRQRQQRQPHVLTAEEASSGRWGIGDVVLPLLGEGSVLPTHAAGEVYRTLLQQDGLSLQDMLAGNPGPFYLRGAYRAVLQAPTDVTWRFARYSSHTDDVTQSPLEAMFCPPPRAPRQRDAQAQGSKAESNGEAKAEDTTATATASAAVAGGSSGDSEMTEAAATAAEGEGEGEGGLLALILSFRLPPASYATMCIRELLKGTTQVSHHASLNPSNANTLVKLPTAGEVKAAAAASDAAAAPDAAAAASVVTAAAEEEKAQ